jgi:uncharacterized membrane protein YqaE (UPF0057 family)
MPRTATLILICVAAFILGPAAQWLGIMSMQDFLGGSASSDAKGITAILVLVFGWIPGCITAAALAIPTRNVSFGDAMHVTPGSAFIGMLTSCAAGPTNPFG